MSGMMRIELNPELLHAHEVVDQCRLDSLIESIATIGVSVPVVVTRFSSKWIVVDGAHRTNGAKMAGLSTIPCDVLDIPPDLSVNGWAHRYSSPVQLDRPTGAGPVLAVYAGEDGETFEIRANSQDPQDLWQSAWDIAAQLPAEPCVRRPDLVPGSFCWQPPPWHIIAHCALTFEPWPAGFTNFQQVFAQVNAGLSPTSASSLHLGAST